MVEIDTKSPLWSSNFKFKANRLFFNVEDDSVSFHIKLPKLLHFQLRSQGLNCNFSNWMPWEKVFLNGSVTLRNKKGDINAQDKETIIAICPQSASGMLFRLVLALKSVGNMVLAVNVIPGSVAQLHERCMTQGLPTTHVHHPVYKPSLKEKVNSIIVPYAKLEKPEQKFCLAHLPVIEILVTGDEDRTLPQSSALREKLLVSTGNIFIKS